MFALLFLLGAQVLEATHYHSAGETLASCASYHGASGAVLPANIPSLPVFAAAAVLVFFLRARTNDTPVPAAFLPRGPPDYS